MKSLLFGLILFLTVSAIAGKAFNSGVISGTIKDDKQETLPYTTVFLKNLSDSSLYKGEISNEAGEFSFNHLREGTYFLEIKSIGYQVYHSDKISISESDPEFKLGSIVLLTESKTLNAVNVIAEKPFIERQVDRTVVNVENSIIHSGSSVMDVMEKLPGVQVNQDGQISLKGKQGLIIMIDGKPTNMSGQDLVNFLRSSTASNVQKIEIITNPSAKHDAAGNAGIINIVMKKNKREGFNGSVNAGYGQGRYEKMNAGINISYKEKKYNLFAGYNLSYRKGFNNLTLNRKFYYADTLNTVFDTDNYIVFPFNTHSPRIGADFFLSKRTTLSFMGSSFLNSFNSIGDNHTNILNGSGTKLYSYDFKNRSFTKSFNYAFNSQLKHQLDTTGKEITVDLDYATYGNNSDQRFTNTAINNDGALLNETIMIGDQDANLSIYSAKADYTNPFKNGSKLEAGLKSSYVESDSDIKFYNQSGDDLVFDSLQSNHFIYKENINAAYLNYFKEFKKLSVQIGLRAEHTGADGKQLITGQTFNRNYVQLFPSIFADYKFNKNHGININLGRRIDRPAYQQMNPFRRFIDATTFSEGNPYLLPQLTYNSELTYSYANMFFITLGYSYTTDNITDVLIQDGEKKITIQTVANLAEVHSYNANLVFSKKLTKWWTTNTSILTYYAQYTGTVNNYSFNQGWPSFTFNSSNSFSIGKGLSAELSFLYNHKTLYGVTFIHPNHNLTAGLQQSLFDKRATITVNYSDIFWKAYPSGVTQFGNVNENWTAKRDTRVLNITFNYRFGKGQVLRGRRNTGADDEKRRAG